MRSSCTSIRVVTDAPTASALCVTAAVTTSLIVSAADSSAVTLASREIATAPGPSGTTKPDWALGRSWSDTCE